MVPKMRIAAFTLLLLAAFSVPIMAHSMATLTTPNDWDGYVNSANLYLNHSYGLVAGANNPLPGNYAAVAKFPVVITDTQDPNYGQSLIGDTPIYSATLELAIKYVYFDAGVTGKDAVYIQLQHYRYDNALAVGAQTDGNGYYMDSTTTNVDNIGDEIAVYATDTGNLTWDVTAAVERDRALGYTHSAFRVITTDGTGNRWSSGNYAVWFHSADTSAAAAPKLYVEQDGLAREVKVPLGKEGMVAAGGRIDTTTSMAVGNNNTAPYGYRAVMKFPLDNTLESIDQAILKAWRVRGLPGTTGYGGAYVQLQHYLYDNAVDLTATDGSTTNVENIGDPVFLADYPALPYHTPLEWDVAQAVAADAAAGYSYSSFRLLPVDENGVYINQPDNAYAGYICSQNNNGTWSWAPNNPDLYPRLAMGYEPVLELKPSTQREGWWYRGNSSYGSNTNWLAVGNINHLNTLCASMVKFRLDDVAQCRDAVFKLWPSSVAAGDYGYGGVYVKLQWCTYDSLTPTHANDTIDPNYTDIGEPVLIQTGTGLPFTWDVTEQLNAAIDAGFSYCSFRIQPSDVDGNLPTAHAPYCAFFYSQDSGWPPAGAPPSNPSLYPRIEVAYDPFDCGDVYEKGYDHSSDLTGDCYVNQADLGVVGSEWLTCTTPGEENCVFQEATNSGTIIRGTAVVDGDLSEWDTQIEWIPLDSIYYGDPCDVTDAKMALRWNEDTDKIYAAVEITDTTHWFTDSYGTSSDWDQSDRLEIFSQGSGLGGTYLSAYCDIAQQYIIAPNTTGGIWASWPEGLPLLGNPAPGLEYAVSITGDIIRFEVGVQQFDNYDGRPGVYSGTVYTDLTVGDTVRFDLVYDTRWGSDSAQFGMLSANEMTGKYFDANAIAPYELVESIPCGAWGYMTADFNTDCIVDLNDFTEFAQQWMWCNDPTDPECVYNW